MDYSKLYKDVLNIDPKVRFATVCDMTGKMLSGGHREGVKNLLTPEESMRSLQQSATAWKSRNELASKIGKGRYVLAEYEKIKRIVVPLDDNHLLYVTTEVEADHASIIKSIMKLKAK